mmetsp:Transcript_15411/g.40832  ORF Transcript_15411/g.40832 Transcript_15411/m.40832 type:complete len:203 (-) Transcript_15411:1284-1892(-)
MRGSRAQRRGRGLRRGEGERERRGEEEEVSRGLGPQTQSSCAPLLAQPLHPRIGDGEGRLPAGPEGVVLVVLVGDELDAPAVIGLRPVHHPSFLADPEGIGREHVRADCRLQEPSAALLHEGRRGRVLQGLPAVFRAAEQLLDRRKLPGLHHVAAVELAEGAVLQERPLGAGGGRRLEEHLAQRHLLGRGAQGVLGGCLLTA